MSGVMHIIPILLMPSTYRNREASVLSLCECLRRLYGMVWVRSEGDDGHSEIHGCVKGFFCWPVDIGWEGGREGEREEDGRAWGIW